MLFNCYLGIINIVSDVKLQSYNNTYWVFLNLNYINLNYIWYANRKENIVNVYMGYKLQNPYSLPGHQERTDKEDLATQLLFH